MTWDPREGVRCSEAVASRRNPTCRRFLVPRPLQALIQTLRLSLAASVVLGTWPPAAAMAAVGGRQEEVEGTAPAGLLELPDLLLHVILSHLTSVGDLGAVAASCSSLRALVRGSNWDQPAALAANVFTPALPGSLVWAAERMPQVSSSHSSCALMERAGCSWRSCQAGKSKRHLPPYLPYGCITLPHLQLRSVDLSGATACSDADLLPLSQLGHLTSLSVAGLWRVTVSSCCCAVCLCSAHVRSDLEFVPSSSLPGNRLNTCCTFAMQGASSNITTWPPAGDSGRRRSRAGHTQQLDVLGGIVASNRGLVTLDLSGTAVPVGTGLAAVLAQLTAGVPNATKPAHGLRCLRLAGCPRQDGGGPAALREVLLECPALQELDVSSEWAVRPPGSERRQRQVASNCNLFLCNAVLRANRTTFTPCAGCRWLTADALPQSGDAFQAALSGLPVERARRV